MQQMRIGFIDYSRDERNKILSTLKMLEEGTALDELGIGVIRDGYADRLFPGISTLQTRAKYFVLIPYIFQTAKERAEEGKLQNAKVMLQWINDREDLIVETLKNHSKSDIGIIGINTFQQKRSVKIKPSSIYWNGLRTFGILRRNDISIYEACKLICTSAQRKRELEIRTDEDSFDDSSATRQDNTLFLPINDKYDYFKEAGMGLTIKEAEFLRDCILRSPITSRSLLGFFINQMKLCDSFDSIPDEILPEPIREDYLHAKDFARFIYLAHLRYNVIFSRGTDDAMADKFKKSREEFLSSLFDLDSILGSIRCPPTLKTFCRDFLECLITGDLSSMDKIIVAREKSVKTTRAKLCRPEEYIYDPKNPIHDYKLNYRFPTAKIILEDIITGLGGEQHV